MHRSALLFAVAACSHATAIQGAGEPDAATLRAEGPVALDRLLARYDAADDAGRARLAPLVDRVAAQRFATVSRLYWYTDLDAATEASRASGKPILSLRMLGRLDEDRSCANSRYFRVVLYGNAGLSRFLRDHFVLHWSSERPVPKLTIDFGDGRAVETTIAGNSAHYVLDEQGRVIDVLPGLMTPAAFRQELEIALMVVDADPPALASHHAARADAIAALWGRFGAAEGSDLLAAERVTITKMRTEWQPARQIVRQPMAEVPVDSAVWGDIGARLLEDRRIAQVPVLDAQARGLVARLAPVDWSRDGAPLDADGLAALIAGFEQSVIADTGLNLTRMRAAVHAELAARAAEGRSLALDDVNRWIYRDLFLTPAEDRWLGMAAPGVFTGLSGDGVNRAD
jgi:hypothetical protein